MPEQLLILLKQYLNIGLAGCVGIVLSAVAANHVRRWEIAEDKERFEQQSTVVEGRLQQQVDSYMQLTRSVGAFYNTNQDISLQDFQELTRSLLPHHDGLLGLGLIEKVALADRPAYEQELQSYGFPNAEIREFNAVEELITAQDRPVYFSTTYIEPFTSFQEKIGFDSGSIPQRLITLKRAERLGVIVSTALVNLENGQPGIIYYYPVFKSNYTEKKSTDIDEERQNPGSSQLGTDEEFQGAVFSMYELQTWIEISLLDLNLSGIDFYLYRLPQDQLDSALSKTSVAATEYFLIAYDADTQTLTQSPDQANLNNIDSNKGPLESQCGYDRPWLSCIRSINIARQELSLLIVPSENRVVPRAQSIGVLLIGLLSTSFFVMYVLLTKRNTMKIKAQNLALKQLLEKLQQTQAQLVQREKMSSLGELVAGIAHEFNNPLGFITANLEYISNYSDSLINLLNLYLTHYPEPHPEIQKNIEAIELDFILKDISKILISMEVGGERLRQIVLSLRNFSRLDEATLKAVDIHEGIDNTIMILSHRLKADHNRAEVKVVKNYGDLPLIQCYPGQINQVFMNILANAIDVLEEKSERPSVGVSGQGIRLSEDEFIFYPQIEISTLKIDENWISIQISDNGMGIPEDIQDRLFNPFFTTKPVGKGTGLGLSISYKIVHETHGGHLSFQSELLRGTQFIIKLPISKDISRD